MRVDRCIADAVRAAEAGRYLAAEYYLREADDRLLRLPGRHMQRVEIGRHLDRLRAVVAVLGYVGRFARANR